MADAEIGRVGRLEGRVNELEIREAARDVKVEIATAAMNRNAGTNVAIAVAVLGAVVGFILTGSH